MSSLTRTRPAPSMRSYDVEAMLDAGIDVISTVNVQHIESLNDVVRQITGIQQRETVPDAVVRSADRIELVDLSPQALRDRLAEGVVYPAARWMPHSATISPGGNSRGRASSRCCGLPTRWIRRSALPRREGHQ